MFGSVSEDNDTQADWNKSPDSYAQDCVMELIQREAPGLAPSMETRTSFQGSRPKDTRSLPLGWCSHEFFRSFAEPYALEAKFRALALNWKREIRAISSTTEICMHPSYQQIIGMGEDAIPLILSELQDAPNYWFWALKAITGEDPVPDSDRGRITRMQEAWLKWGRSHRHFM